MKRKLSLAQGMVEYALLLTMVTVPMIVIYATLGDAAGDVWQAVVDGLSDTQMFEIRDYSLMTTETGESTTGLPTEAAGTPLATNTLDPSLPTETPTNTLDPSIPTDTPTATDVPTQTAIPTQTEIPPTATPFVPATYTFTPENTATYTAVPTEVPSVTPIINAITSASLVRNKRVIVVSVTVSTTVDLTFTDTLTNISQTITCIDSCKAKFDPLDGGGFITIESDYGDDMNLSYPPA